MHKPEHQQGGGSQGKGATSLAMDCSNIASTSSHIGVHMRFPEKRKTVRKGKGGVVQWIQGFYFTRWKGLEFWCTAMYLCLSLLYSTHLQMGSDGKFYVTWFLSHFLNKAPQTIFAQLIFVLQQYFLKRRLTDDDSFSQHMQFLKVTLHLLLAYWLYSCVVQYILVAYLTPNSL